MAETIDIQLKKGVLGLCVLALLARNESYAYEIASTLSDAIGMGEGTIYPLMRRMQTDGLVDTRLVESSSGPSRKYYRLTAAGHAALDAQAAEWRGFARSVDALLDAKPPESEPQADQAPNETQEG
ncbi:PadR family transcriptional regulator [Asticcacaulis sp. AND118]|uniref:PadR family transcriptional regulator n=1 Tax=Asticcacaulis sp. AND118 TaxID=2840468 RepID=UPI001CFFEC21|nr:PadR family transcriptional regulator [Asticcacaulis sp. AND118]UDF05380.1 PadR family transcriptional regulator [Asticcacaulis sp. AND118]